jgi:hypothetical protein
MISLDTIKLSMPIDCSLGINMNDDRIQRVEKVTSFSRSSSVQIAGESALGIGRTFIENAINIKLSISAKSLLDNYLKGINTNTIEQVIDNYNSYSPLKLDKNKVIEHASILLCDSTQMIYPTYKLSTCRDSMIMLRTNSRCTITSYNKRKNSGIEINSSVKKEKRRLIMYSKHLELTKSMNSKKSFLNNCKDANKIIKQSLGSWRVEQNHTSFKSIRNRFNVQDTRLISVLNSNSNPNYNYLVKIRKNSKDIDLFLDDYKDKSIAQIERLKGVENICNYFDRDINLIASFIKSRTTHRNHYRHLLRYKDAIKAMNDREMKIANSTTTTNVINHIFELVKNS